jgi:hypothetical protein
MRTISERKQPYPYYERRSHIVPDAPDPAAISAGDGMEVTRALARCYLPNALRLLAGIAFNPASEAALHTKMLAAKEIVSIAGVIPQLTPAPPPPSPRNESADNNKSSPPPSPLLPHAGSIDSNKPSPLDDAPDNGGEPHD